MYDVVTVEYKTTVAMHIFSLTFQFDNSN